MAKKGALSLKREQLERLAVMSLKIDEELGKRFSIAMGKP